MPAASPQEPAKSPPGQLSHKVSYIEPGPGTMDPIKNAENQLLCIEDDFNTWLHRDCSALTDAWENLKPGPVDQNAFNRFHKALLTLTGNAAMLNCAIAGRLAAPLARLFERTSDVVDHTTTIETALAAIRLTAVKKLPDNDPRLHEIQRGLETIVNRWLANANPR